MNKAKVITICGSFKFISKIKEETERLTLEGNCVLSIIYATKKIEAYNEKFCKLFQKMHFQRIEMCDAIYVVNVNGYIGDATKKEIDYAKSLGKEILSLESIDIK